MNPLPEDSIPEDPIPDDWLRKYHECLGREFSNPEYFRVHHILVCAWMLQTGGYSPGFEPEAASLLAEFLASPSGPSKRRIRELGGMYSGKRGKISLPDRRASGGRIRSGPGNLTVMNLRLDSPEHYREDVLAWARDVLRGFGKDA